MKYITYEHNRAESYGALRGDTVFPAGYFISGEAPRSLLDFIRAGARFDFSAGTGSNAKPVPLAEVKIKAPIPRPSREIICLGKNYAEHVNEIKATAPANASIPPEPVYFAKSVFSIAGCFDTVPLSAGAAPQFDYEAELAVVIGKECSNANESEAYEYIFGYAVLNDITERGLQAKHGQWYLGKSLEGTCPFGPVIADKNEIPFPHDLKISSRVNGELRQNSNTSQMIFKIPYIISQLSRTLKLYPGDIIATGTPAGVGHGFSPPKNLKRGDVVECEIENIGALRNAIGDPINE